MPSAKESAKESAKGAEIWLSWVDALVYMHGPHYDVSYAVYPLPPSAKGSAKGAETQLS